MALVGERCLERAGMLCSLRELEYRKKHRSLRPGHVKPDPSLRISTGTKGILKIGGVQPRQKNKLDNCILGGSFTGAALGLQGGADCS